MTELLSCRLTIIYTGGTLGMTRSEHGLVPAPGLAQRFKTALRASSLYRHRVESIDWSLVENQPLLDSANIVPADWEALALQCQSLSGTDAIVIVHGTDTLAYSAGALAYFLQRSPVPVVITGAQNPLGFTPSDALDNLAGSMLAARDAEPGVWVYFHRQLMPAARAVKKDAISFTGFEAPRLRDDSPHQPPATIDWQPRPRKWQAIQVCSAHMVPGYRASHLRALVDCQPQALILALYGRGTLADSDTGLVETIDEAVKSGVIVVAVSQCYIGEIDFSIYATGTVLERVGVLNGGDMTLEAAYTKLMVLLRLGYSREQVRQLFTENITNEISIKQP